MSSSRAATVERLAHAVAALDAFRLAGLSPMVTAGGSLVAALAVLEGALTAGEGVGGGQRRRCAGSASAGASDAEAETALEATGERDFLARRRGSWSCSTL